MSKVRTLIFHPALAPYRIDLFNELARYLDLKVIFLNENLVSQKFDQQHLHSLLKCEYEYICSGVNILGRQIRWGIARAISEYKPDVVVGIEYSPTTLVIALLKLLHPNRHWSLVTMSSDSMQICTKTTLMRRAARRFVLHVTKGMIVYSNAVKSWYVKYGIPEEAIGVCSNIQSEDRFRNLLMRARPLAIRLLHEKKLLGKRVILFVGRLVQLKGVDRIITAFAGASRSDPDSRLLIIGDGPEKKKLVELAKSKRIRERIIFLGRLEGLDLMAWYLIGQTLVLASDSETYGAVVVEALLAGMPVLCSSVAGAVDLIREKQNGRIFDPYDIASLTHLFSAQLEKTAPLEAEAIGLKESLMPISFEDSVKDFVRAVEYAAGRHDKTAKQE